MILTMLFGALGFVAIVLAVLWVANVTDIITDPAEQARPYDQDSDI